MVADKHDIFLSEPIGSKPATDLPGIDDDVGERLEKEGFKEAFTVLGQFLLLKKQKDLFLQWLIDLGNATPEQANDCYECLHEYSNYAI